MSAPATRTDIQEHPTKMGVTSAASGKELEADVQRKMKLWGVLEAFRDGRMPDNQQIDRVLEYAIGHSPVNLQKLSPEGRVLIDDTRDILETLRMMVAEKNADELFQNAVYQSYHADPNVAKQSNVVPVSKGEAKEDANQAAAHLRVLLTLFITNSETRKLVKDLGFIGRDMFATAASKAADKARPAEHEMNQVDREAPSKEWIGADGKRIGANETPEVQMKGPDGREVRYNPKDAPSDATVRDADGQTRSAGQAYNEAQQAKEQAKGEARSRANEAQQQTGGSQGIKETLKSHAQDLNASRDPNASYSQQKEQVRGAATQKADENTPDRDVQGEAQGQAQQAKERAMQAVPDSVRNTANDAMRTSKEIVQDSFPEERREQFIYRLKKVLVDCQEHKDYQEAMEWLLDAFQNYQGHAKHVANKADNARSDLQSEPSVAGATDGFVTLLERFANGRSMDPVFNALDRIYVDVQNDPELSKWFTRVNNYAHRVLLDSGWVLEDESTREAEKIRDDGKYFFTDKYKGHFDSFFNEVERFFTAMGDDPLNKRLGEDVRRLYKDLLFNEAGDLSFKPKLWKDIRDVILPMFINQVGYVPIPRIEYDDDKIAIVVENLILSGPNLFPNVVTLENLNRFTFSPYSNINKTLDSHHHTFRLGLSQIQADIRDVAFAFRRKKGWPLKSDHGLADIVISGKGISVDVHLESVENRRDSVFRVKNIDVEIDNMKWSIRESKHDFLYKLVKSTLNGVIKKAITVAVQGALRSALENLDDQLAEIRNQAEDTKNNSQDDRTRTQALKDLYARKKENAEANAEKGKEHVGQARVVLNRESQLNPDLGHSSGKSISKRLWKTEDLAKSGNKWKSPAFDLLDSRHPAATGQHHPDAVQNAGAGKSLTSQAQDPSQGDGNLLSGHQGASPTHRS